MARDDTDPNTSPISRVTNRVVPPSSVKRVKSVSVEPRLAQARRAFASLVAAAEDPPLQQRAVFSVTGLGELHTGTLRRFRIAEEHGGPGKGFTVSYEYRGREPLKHVTESEQVHKALRKTLFNLGLEFRSASSLTAHKIEVEAAVPAWVTVLARDDARAIEVTMRNVAMFGETTYRIAPEHFDRRLIDALVELISSGGRDFYRLVAALPRARG